VRYRVGYPSAAAAQAANNRAFLRETGALLDGPATYLYLAEHKLAPAHVTFEVPAGWRIATGLVPTTEPRTFFAPSYDVLADSPVLMGALRVWRFTAAGAPVQVAYWPQPDATPFDTAAFVASVRAIVDSAAGIFGGVPYRDFAFLYVDGAGGGLEHLNSTTIGAPSAALAADPRSRTSVTAHEFFHLWNVKRLRPAPLGPFDYQRPVRTTALWWSEGVTDFFADEIERRAGLTSETQRGTRWPPRSRATWGTRRSAASRPSGRAGRRGTRPP
jgi:predicted metalloprotease with PDZ domain